MKEQVREQAEEILKKLTLEEKIGMIHGAALFQTAGVERLGIPPLKMSDGPMGVRQEFEPANWKTIDHTDDYVTYLPCNSALASTWSRDLACEIYLPAFHDAVTKGDAYTIMGAYNKIYGEHCCQSDFLLKKILREEWRYDGVVIHRGSS